MKDWSPILKYVFITLWCPANRLEWYKGIILLAHILGMANNAVSFSGVVANLRPTWGMTVTGYKPKLNWHIAGCQGSFLMVGEVIQHHLTTTTHLKLSSPQPIRCCPSTGHLLHCIHGAQDISDKWTVTVAPNNYKRSIKKPALRFGCWNVCSMMTGLSADLQTISGVWKTAIINSELFHLQIDIVALQETWLSESRCLREFDYTFSCQGKKKEDVHGHGVGFAVRNMLLNIVQLGSSATECLLSLQLNSTDGPINLLCVYAPTLMAPDDIKDDFYSQLDTIIKAFRKQKNLVILGNFNAHIGSDNKAWSNWLSHFGVGKCNDNSHWLLELCSYHELCITNTFFGTKLHHRVSWRYPKSKHWHQLDLILMRWTHLKNFLVTRT